MKTPMIPQDVGSHLQGDQKVSVHLMITVQKNMQKYKCRHMMRRLVFGLECRVGAVRPIFFSETLNSQRYCDTTVYPFIVQLKEDDIDKAYFQQDGAMTHTAHMSVALLDDMFVDRTTSQTIWPPRSPDVSPPDFFSLGCDEKLSVFEQSPHS